MWGNWLEKGREIAEKAQAAALEIDKKINESVGLPTTEEESGAVVTSTATTSADEDDALNDAWGDDDDDVDLDATAAMMNDEKNIDSSVESHGKSKQTDGETAESAATESSPKQDNGATTKGKEEATGDEGWDDENLAFNEDETEHSHRREEDKVFEEEQFESSSESPVIEDQVASTQEASSVEPPLESVAENNAATQNVAPTTRESQQESEYGGEEDDLGISADMEDTRKESQQAMKVVKDDGEHNKKPGEEEQSATKENPLEEAPEPAAPIQVERPDDEQAPLPDNERLEQRKRPKKDDIAELVEPEYVANEPYEESPTGDPKESLEDLKCANQSPDIEPSALNQADQQELEPNEPAQEQQTDSSDAVSDPEHTAFMQTEAKRTLTSSDNNSAEISLKLQEQLEIQFQLKRQIDDLQGQLQRREDQLFSKTEQMATMENMHEQELEDLRLKIQNTKDEAKRRIQKAKERVMAMEAQLKTATSSRSADAEDVTKQAEIIAALREEGQKLALKQAEMESKLKSRNLEARQLKEQLADETEAKDSALERISKLEAELRATKEELASARRGESQADKLETELRSVKEDSDMKAASILSLEQVVKELKQDNKDLQARLEEAQKGAAIETEREQKKIRKEHSDAVSDLENKLRTSEREAAVREDALRHEVAELRKRWQDAVRRADSLSMDVQSSTAPLLRQLESAERQNRSRAAAWAELENSLRTELEESVISNEKLSKERSEWKTKFTRLERASAEAESELKSVRSKLEEKTHAVTQLEDKLKKLENEHAKMREEWAEVERLANEGVSRVRSEMAQTIVENEERHQSQLKSVQAELQREKEKREQLERQVEELVDRAGMIVAPEILMQPAALPESKPIKLRESMGQVDILAGALNGLGDEDDESDDDDEASLPHHNGSGSFAALAELTSRLKTTKVELEALRKSLEESERSREWLVEELAEARNAKEKLPLFESRVQELTTENEQMTLEIQSLQEDISEVRELYRTQLNVLLEEKAAGRTHSAEHEGKDSHVSNVEDETFPASS